MAPDLILHLGGYDRPARMPESIAVLVAAWDEHHKSPHSDSFYSRPGVTWGFKPEGCLRAADHWNFTTTDGRRHCVPDQEVGPGHWAVARYTAGLWHVLHSAASPNPAQLQRQRLALGQAAILRSAARATPLYPQGVFPLSLIPNLEGRKAQILDDLVRQGLAVRYALDGCRGSTVPAAVAQVMTRLSLRRAWSLSEMGQALRAGAPSSTAEA